MLRLRVRPTIRPDPQPAAAGPRSESARLIAVVICRVMKV